MKFTVSDRVLRDMFTLCSFVIPEDELVFFALRGVQPIEFGGSDFANAHEVVAVPIDYRHMRCSIGQWDTGRGRLAVFVGSSVPHISSIEAHLSESGNGVNRLASGFFGRVPGMPDNRYMKGNHGEDRHLAFRNESRLPVWRTGDDTDYEGDDRLEYEIVYDNLHCARQTNETASRFSSRGCVVVAGKPGDSGAERITSEIGPWKRFLQNAYSLDQRRFALAIFEENEALRTSEIGIAGRSPTVRFGSRGILVERLQAGLLAKGYDIGTDRPDGLFGGATAKALRQFQFDVFGKDGTDLIAGPGTAEALGIEWPANGAQLARLLEPTPLPDPPEEGDAVLVSVHAASEPAAPVGLAPNPSLKIEIDVAYKPLPSWQIKKQSGAERWNVTIEGIAEPVFLGRFFEYDDYPEGPTRGLARTAGATPAVKYKPTDWTSLGLWPE
ncbi:MAG TPA: peptidoglycan-binding domain-containing protein, partial [Bauldia sp.]|nr:peptidoglycan-binding domain-containing protein [Bauldia sp.]